MAKYLPCLDKTFQALSDPIRRAVIVRLAHSPASVSELAQPFSIALPSFVKHIRVLEDSGLIKTKKTGRIRTCALQVKQLAWAEEWLGDQQSFWESRVKALDEFLLNTKSQEGDKNDE